MGQKSSLFSLPCVSLLVLLMASPSFADDAQINLAKEILSMTADETCDTDEQCKSVGLGDKPCGGFNEYRIYSLKSVDEPALLAKVLKYNQADKENNLKNNMASTCDILLQPATSCVQGQCTSAPGHATIY